MYVIRRHDIHENDNKPCGIREDKNVQRFVMLSVVMLNVLIVIILARKDCFQNKSKFITEDHFTKHMNITTIH